MDEINFDDDPSKIWATQAQIAYMFGVKPQNITWHIKNIYMECVLDRNITCKETLQVNTEGENDVIRAVKQYSFEVIIEIGNRINTIAAKEFRKWLFSILMMYIKGTNLTLRL